MINKDKNVNLQLTINKKTYNKLLQIQAEINELVGIELSKSQVIDYIINKYETKQAMANNSKMVKRYENERESYKQKVIALKDNLNVSYKRLSQLIDVSINNLKYYGTGKQTPSDKNKIKIDNALKHYGIKL